MAKKTSDNNEVVNEQIPYTVVSVYGYIDEETGTHHMWEPGVLLTPDEVELLLSRGVELQEVPADEQ